MADENGASGDVFTGPELPESEELTPKQKRLLAKYDALVSGESLPEDPEATPGTIEPADDPTPEAVRNVIDTGSIDQEKWQEEVDARVEHAKGQYKAQKRIDKGEIDSLLTTVLKEVGVKYDPQHRDRWLKQLLEDADKVAKAGDTPLPGNLFWQRPAVPRRTTRIATRGYGLDVLPETYVAGRQRQPITHEQFVKEGKEGVVQHRLVMNPFAVRALKLATAQATSKDFDRPVGTGGAEDVKAATTALEEGKAEREEVARVWRTSVQRTGGQEVRIMVDGEVLDLPLVLSGDKDANISFANQLTPDHPAAVAFRAGLTLDHLEKLRSAQTAIGDGTLSLEEVTEILESPARAKALFKSMYDPVGAPGTPLVPLTRTGKGLVFDLGLVEDFMRVQHRLDIVEEYKETPLPEEGLEAWAQKRVKEELRGLRQKEGAYYARDPEDAWRHFTEGTGYEEGGLPGFVGGALNWMGEQTPILEAIRIEVQAPLRRYLGHEAEEAPKVEDYTAFHVLRNWAGQFLPAVGGEGSVILPGEEAQTPRDAEMFEMALGKGRPAHFMDALFAMTPGMGVAAGWGRAHEDLIGKYGSISGRGPEALELLNKHLRDPDTIMRAGMNTTDPVTLFVTLGHAFQPNLLAMHEDALELGQPVPGVQSLTGGHHIALPGQKSRKRTFEEWVYQYDNSQQLSMKIARGAAVGAGGSVTALGLLLDPDAMVIGAVGFSRGLQAVGMARNMLTPSGTRLVGRFARAADGLSSEETGLTGLAYLDDVIRRGEAGEDIQADIKNISTELVRAKYDPSGGAATVHQGSMVDIISGQHIDITLDARKSAGELLSALNTRVRATQAAAKKVAESVDALDVDALTQVKEIRDLLIQAERLEEAHKGLQVYRAAIAVQKKRAAILAAKVALYRRSHVLASAARGGEETLQSVIAFASSALDKPGITGPREFLAALRAAENTGDVSEVTRQILEHSGTTLEGLTKLVEDAWTSATGTRGKAAALRGVEQLKKSVEAFRELSLPELVQSNAERFTRLADALDVQRGQIVEELGRLARMADEQKAVRKAALLEVQRKFPQLPASGTARQASKTFYKAARLMIKEADDFEAARRLLEEKENLETMARVAREEQQEIPLKYLRKVRDTIRFAQALEGTSVAQKRGIETLFEAIRREGNEDVYRYLNDGEAAPLSQILRKQAPGAFDDFLRPFEEEVRAAAKATDTPEEIEAAVQAANDRVMSIMVGLHAQQRDIFMEATSAAGAARSSLVGVDRLWGSILKFPEEIGPFSKSFKLAETGLMQTSLALYWTSQVALRRWRTAFKWVTELEPHTLDISVSRQAREGLVRLQHLAVGQQKEIDELTAAVIRNTEYEDQVYVKLHVMRSYILGIRDMFDADALDARRVSVANAMESAREKVKAAVLEVVPGWEAGVALSRADRNAIGKAVLGKEEMQVRVLPKTADVAEETAEQLERWAKGLAAKKLRVSTAIIDFVQGIKTPPKGNIYATPDKTLRVKKSRFAYSRLVTGMGDVPIGQYAVDFLEHQIRIFAELRLNVKAETIVGAVDASTGLRYFRGLIKSLIDPTTELSKTGAIYNAAERALLRLYKSDEFRALSLDEKWWEIRARLSGAIRSVAGTSDESPTALALFYQNIQGLGLERLRAALIAEVSGPGVRPEIFEAYDRILGQGYRSTKAPGFGDTRSGGGTVLPGQLVVERAPYEAYWRTLTAVEEEAHANPFRKERTRAGAKIKTDKAGVRKRVGTETEVHPQVLSWEKKFQESDVLPPAREVYKVAPSKDNPDIHYVWFRGEEELAHAGTPVQVRVPARFSFPKEGGGTDKVAGGFKFVPRTRDLVTQRPAPFELLDALDLYTRWAMGQLSTNKQRQVMKMLGGIRQGTVRLVAHSFNTKGELIFAPEEFLTPLARAVENVEKELGGASNRSATALEAAHLTHLAITAMRAFKGTLITGVLGLKISYLTASAFFGDITNLLYVQDPLSGAKLTGLGARAYLPDLLNQPSMKSVLFNRQLDQFLSASPNTKVVGADGKVIRYIGPDGVERDLTTAALHQEAMMQGAEDTFHSADARNALRETARIQHDLYRARFQDTLTTWDNMTSVVWNIANEASRKIRYATFIENWLVKGLSKDDAGRAMRLTLYDWASSTSVSERAILGHLALFWTFTKNMLAQGHRIAMEPTRVALNAPDTRLAGSMLEGRRWDEASSAVLPTLPGYSGRYLLGATQLQRTKLLTAMESSGYTAPYDPSLAALVVPGQDLTPEDLERMRGEANIKEYMYDYPIFATGTLSEASRGKLALRGLGHYANYAFTGPRNTPTEALRTYMDIVNNGMVTPILSLLDSAGAVDVEVDYNKAIFGLTDLAKDISTPAFEGLVEAGQEWVGLREKRFDARHWLTQDEALWIAQLGGYEMLEVDSKGRLYLEYKEGDARGAAILYSNGMGAAAMKVLLPSFLRSRLTEDLVATTTGGVVDRPVSRTTAQLLSNARGLFSRPYSDDELKFILQRPAAQVAMEIDQGKLKAVLLGLGELTLGVRVRLYSGAADEAANVDRFVEDIHSALAQPGRSLPISKFDLDTTVKIGPAPTPLSVLPDKEAAQQKRIGDEIDANNLKLDLLSRQEGPVQTKRITQLSEKNRKLRKMQLMHGIITRTRQIENLIKGLEEQPGGESLLKQDIREEIDIKRREKESLEMELLILTKGPPEPEGAEEP